MSGCNVRQANYDIPSSRSRPSDGEGSALSLLDAASNELAAQNGEIAGPTLETEAVMKH